MAYALPVSGREAGGTRPRDRVALWSPRRRARPTPSFAVRDCLMAGRSRLVPKTQITLMSEFGLFAVVQLPASHDAI